MEQDAVSDLDAEIIGWIASSILCDEQKIPCAVELRCREHWICGRAESEQKQPKSLGLKGRPRPAFFHRILLATTKLECEVQESKHAEVHARWAEEIMIVPLLQP
jgi:hypothetical protein